MNRCSHKECIAEAVVLPVVLVYAIKNTAPAKLEFSLPLCLSCSERTVVADLMTEEGWEDIERIVSYGGNLPPDRSLTVINWKAIN